MEIGTLALEEGMRREGEENIEIAGRAAAGPGLALACEPDAGSVLHAGRNIDRQGPLACDAPRARARRAWIVDHLTSALAARTGSLQCEEPLSMPDAALSATDRTSLGSGTGLCARARARFARHRSRNANLRRLAGIGLLQPDLHVVAQIGTTLAAGARAPSGHAEDALEQVREGRAEIRAEPARTAAALLEG